MEMYGLEVPALCVKIEKEAGLALKRFVCIANEHLY